MTNDWQSRVVARRTRSRDGTEIAYEVLEPRRAPAPGVEPRTLLLANGLGGRLHAWQPILEGFGDHDRIITWDFRGLFGSAVPPRPEHLAVPYHAEDALAVLDAEKVDRAVAMGWSMGVQVALSAAISAPERFSALVLLNGTHGHVFTTGFQPVFRMPFLWKRLHQTVELLAARPGWQRRIASIARGTVPLQLALFASYLGPRAFSLRPMLEQYLKDVFATNFTGFMQLFQELDAHSVYPHLPRVTVPALVIAGLLDPLTPAYQSREIARRMPDAQYMSVAWASHFVLAERPARVVPAIAEFLDRRAPRPQSTPASDTRPSATQRQ